jgi:hypothetical protein
MKDNSYGSANALCTGVTSIERINKKIIQATKNDTRRQRVQDKGMMDIDGCGQPS